MKVFAVLASGCPWDHAAKPTTANAQYHAVDQALHDLCLLSPTSSTLAEEFERGTHRGHLVRLAHLGHDDRPLEFCEGPNMNGKTKVIVVDDSALAKAGAIWCDFRASMP